MNVSDEQVNTLLSLLDVAARLVNKETYGLPISEEGNTKEQLIKAVRGWMDWVSAREIKPEDYGANKNALGALYEWDRKHYYVRIYTSGHVMHGDGYTVELSGGSRTVRVDEMDLVPPDNDDEDDDTPSPPWPTLSDVILEAIRRWHADDSLKLYRCTVHQDIALGVPESVPESWREYSFTKSEATKSIYFRFQCVARNEAEATAECLKVFAPRTNLVYVTEYRSLKPEEIV